MPLPPRPWPALTEGDRERFWSKVDKRGPAECWPWTGHTFRPAEGEEVGYGCFAARGQQWIASRIAFHLSGGSTTDQAPNVLHSCDNPPCCNPAHLSAGDHGRNMAECVERDRRRYHRGEGHHNAKITDAEVAAIRAAYEAKSKTVTQLAVEFGLHRSTIRRIGRKLTRTGGQ